MPFEQYIGRFAPTPSGPLHLGSLLAAMASYLDARAHAGRWLLRIEDLDFERNVAGIAEDFLRSLHSCGLAWDGDVTWQSQRLNHYESALAQLSQHVYACACSRKEIADSRLRLALDTEQASQIYPGTCRAGLPDHRVARAYRLRVPEPCLIQFADRLLGVQSQDVASAVGDFVLKRADGFWAYQLAVVVDDADQGVTDIVRGADLLDSSARQIYLQQLLGLPTPRYLHVSVVENAQGEKLSKQTGAAAVLPPGLNQAQILQQALLPAANALGLRLARPATGIADFWELALAAWREYLNNAHKHSAPLQTK